MAEVLKNYTFRGKGRERTYPWDIWSDGQQRLLRRGVDFTILPSSIRSLAHHYASRNNMTVATSLEGEDVIVLQFTPRPATRRQR